MSDLFPDTQSNAWRPLADRMRPARLEDFYGQSRCARRLNPTCCIR